TGGRGRASLPKPGATHLAPGSLRPGPSSGVRPPVARALSVGTLATRQGGKRTGGPWCGWSRRSVRPSMIIQRHAIYQAGGRCGVVAPAGGAAIPMAKARGLRRSKENWSGCLSQREQLAGDSVGRVARHARRQGAAELLAARGVRQQAEDSIGQAIGRQRLLVSYLDRPEPGKRLGVGPLVGARQRHDETRP